MNSCLDALIRIQTMKGQMIPSSSLTGLAGHPRLGRHLRHLGVWGWMTDVSRRDLVILEPGSNLPGTDR